MTLGRDWKPRHCRNSPGYFIGPEGQKVRGYCNAWGCQDCGPAKKRKFLFQTNWATEQVINTGLRWRGLTLTLSRNDGDRNELMGRYWNRFRNSLKKAGYDMRYYLWVKEVQPDTGMLHLHVLIAAFIPWDVIKYYWVLACGGRGGDYRHTRICKAQVKKTAGYMAKYMHEDLDTLKMPKGERRYGMSRNLKQYWPETNIARGKELLETVGYMLFGSNPKKDPVYQEDGVYKAWWRLDGIKVAAPVSTSKWRFEYDPDNSDYLRRAMKELVDLVSYRSRMYGAYLFARKNGVEEVEGGDECSLNVEYGRKKRPYNPEYECHTKGRKSNGTPATPGYVNRFKPPHGADVPEVVEFVAWNISWMRDWSMQKIVEVCTRYLPDRKQDIESYIYHGKEIYD